MTLGAAISKSLITEAFESSQIFRDGKAVTDLTIFAKALGPPIIDIFKGVRLIGEIERVEAKDTYDTLASCLRKTLKECDFSSILDGSTPQWRAILSVYFVWTGIFFYGEGEAGHELWPPIFSGLGLPIDASLSSECGRMFIQCLREHQLETFDSVKEGHVYLTRILLHGLLPEKHIDCFMRELIDNELGGHLGAYSTGEHVITKWKHSDALKYIPKPIQRFVQHGQPVNVSIIGRVLDMARRWNNDSPLLWRQWGLPKYMVDAFRAYVSQPGKAMSRKTVDHDPKEKPYLHFDLAESDTPLLRIPPMRLKTRACLRVVWIDMKEEEREVSVQDNPTLANGWYCLSERDVTVSPSESGWFVEATGADGQIVHEMEVPVQLPTSRNGALIPLFLFCRTTGRQVIAEKMERIPQKVLMVYPLEADIELEGGTLSTQPERLYGRWRGWQYALFALSESGTIHYQGPDASFDENLDCELNFSSSTSEDRPLLADQGEAPPWVRTLDGQPIYTDWKAIRLICTERSYPRWRYAFGKITRLDKDSKVQPLPLEFKKNGKEYHATLPLGGSWEPGVYEITILGPLGLDDVVLPFTYLPGLTGQRIRSNDKEDFVREFRLNLPFEADLLALDRTQVTSRKGAVSVFPQEDKGQAFCALKVFQSSLHPVVVLLARSQVRWSRRNETGLFHWDQWRFLPEDLPIHRVDEIADARVIVQLDKKEEIHKKTDSRQLKVTLIGERDGSESQALMVYDAPSFGRRIQDTWVVDLKKFSDQFKSLSEVECATVAVQMPGSNEEYPLFNLLRNPRLDDFRIDRIRLTGKSERLRVSWTPQPNDPRYHRVLHFFPMATPQQGVIRKRISDGVAPPFEVDLDLPRRAEIWTAQLVVDKSRFGASHLISSDIGSSFSWFRAPKDWIDWLEWPELSYQEIFKKIGTLGCLDNESLLKSMPWTHFLAHFHLGKGVDSFQVVSSMLGGEVLSDLLPHTKGSIWQAKTGQTVRLTARVTQSSVNNDPMASLTNHAPATWGGLRGSIALELSLGQFHKNLGNAGSTWKCSSKADDIYPLMCSENLGEFDLPCWIEEAIDPETRGVLVAQCNFERIWDDPPPLSILRDISHNDKIFLDLQYVPRQDGGKKNNGAFQNKSFATIGERLSQASKSDLMARYFETGPSEERSKAEALLKRWRKWSQRSDVNKLLCRMISGRLDKRGINGLSGVAAIITRLRSHEYWDDCLVGRTTYDESALSELLRETVDLVRVISPKSFLADLILSEIIISWYWNKSLASI